MLTTTAVPATAAAGLVNDASTVIGRVVVVPLAKGEPIGVGMTVPHAAAQPGHRLVRVSVGSVDVAPDVRVGADADLVASFAPTASEPKASVTVVATARVAALDATQQQATPDAGPPGSNAALIGSTTAVTLDCVAADALRVLWARDNARTLRLLVHSGDTPPPASG